MKGLNTRKRKIHIVYEDVCAVNKPVA